MLEKLVPGDQVMCIPAANDRGCVIGVPYGTCGEIIKSESISEAIDNVGNVTHKMGCIVRFPSHICEFHPSGNWVRESAGLMKITPDDKLKEEEREVIAEDALPPLLTVDQLRQLFANRGENA